MVGYRKNINKYRNIKTNVNGILFDSKKEAGRYAELLLLRGQDAKSIVKDWVDTQIDFKWPQKVLKSGPRKGQTVLADGWSDMADAYVIARRGLLNICK